MESNKSDCLDTSGLKWFNGASNIPLHICMFTLDFWQLVYNDWIWIVLVAFLIAFILAFGIGANDVANSFGSSVGAKVLTLKQACILGTIFEILGAVLIGATVLDTIRKGIISIDLFPNSTAAEFMVAALSGSCIWMWVASFLKLPLSATHSLVGATIGFSLVAHGASGVNWKQLSYIIGSWFASSLLSGGISTLLFLFIFKIVRSKEKPLEPGLKLLPIFYSFTIARNLFSFFYKGSQCERFQSHHGPLVYSGMLLRCVHCAILSHIRLPNLVSYPSCLSANYKDLIDRIFISRLQISIRYLHDIFHMVYKGPISKGIPIRWVKVVLYSIQCGITMLTDHKRWCTGLVIAMLFSRAVALPISDTNREDKIHIFPKLTSLWSFKNPEMEYTCPNVDSNFNLTIEFRQYKCRDWEDIICMDSVSVGRVFFCIPKSTSCSIGIGWTVEAVDDKDVTVKESFCQEDYYQSEPSRCYNACKTKHERLDLIPPKYLLHSKGDYKGPAILTCNATDGFYNPHNKTYVAFDSNLPADFCTNVNIVNPCAKGYMPLNNGTCLDICSQAYQELVTSSRCKALSGKDRDSENKDIPATLKPVNQGGVSTRKRNNDDMEDTNEEVNDVAEKIHRGGIKMTVVKIMVMTVGLFIISPFLVVAVLNYALINTEDYQSNKKKNCLIAGEDQQVGGGGEKLKKTHDNTLTQLILHSLNDQMKFVGALIRNGLIEGTVFRVGSCYVMTAYHVIQPIIWDDQLIKMVPERLFSKNIFVNFNAAVGDCPRKRPHIKKICYINTELDVAILKLSTMSGVPAKMLLWKGNFNLNMDKVSVIGYGHPKEPLAKHFEPPCVVIKRGGSEVQAALKYYNREKENFKLALGNNTEVIDKGYGGIDNANKIFFHGFLEHGASGSPLLVCNDPKSVYVVGMLTNGLPEFFFHLPAAKKIEFPPEHRFHSGSRMQLIYEDLMEVDRNLAEDLF